MSDKPGITQYIDLREQTDEERISEFIRTVDFAIDSLDRQKYGNQIFADVIAVACDRITDIFDVNELFEIKLRQDCVRTSAYIPKSVDVCYSLFAEKVKKIREQYTNPEVDIQDFYIDLLLAKDELYENLQPRGAVLVKKNKAS